MGQRRRRALLNNIDCKPAANWFQEWANGVAARFGYNVRFLPVGPEDSAIGSPTQMGVFALSNFPI